MIRSGLRFGTRVALVALSVCASCAERHVHNDAGASGDAQVTMQDAARDAEGDARSDEDASAVGCSPTPYTLLGCEGAVPASVQRPPDPPVYPPDCGDPIPGNGGQVIRDFECLTRIVAYVCPGFDLQSETAAADLSANMVVLIVSEVPECGGTITVPRVERCDGVARIEFSHVFPSDPDCNGGCDWDVPFGRLVKVARAGSVAALEFGPCIH